MTVFAYRLELPLVFRIFDIMLVEGMDVMLRIAFAIIKRSEAIILGMGFDEVLQYLKRGILDEYNEDHKKLVQDIYSVKLSSRKLNAYTTEHERHVAKAIQESLELNNLQVLQKQMMEHVRHLETKLASLNREHVELANELVSTRVEVTHRQEQNELYRQELSELSKALDVIPLEIERRSREKLDTLMEENNKLANDNAILEDKLASLEMTVIDLKMRFAESENDKEMVQRRLREMKKYMAVHT
ncbi:hypothetical protein BZG36_01107 [Bifiguratus adelaidae]|uniref:Rab-GAP TBC domain-containing protein n=1 Tax=Bifiguratus adelaidae TaxID=1938954 RepID=A0A261Y625_9FUNG|nr:hypothetical protein BZG36_01107 [Bifiguratus adelaidae]